MYRLVITEKPSAAQSIAAVLHAEKREGGFFSGGDWLVGINATRLFSLLYGPTLNIGHVVSHTLALIVQREAEISAFEPTPFYTVELDCGGITVASERLPDPAEANAIAAACKGNSAAVAAVEHAEKSEKAPALYDLTTLQRGANRLKGYTAQQILDYLQNLYEKKLCTCQCAGFPGL